MAFLHKLVNFLLTTHPPSVQMTQTPLYNYSMVLGEMRMANGTLPAGAGTSREAAAVIQWHPGFCSAVEFELRKNKSALSFQREYPLTKGPLTADLLVVELLDNVQIENEIGRIFRKYNIFEFKSPEDGLSIDDYYKATAYACLFKCSAEQVNGIPASEITLSLVRDTYPREMTGILTQSGARITQKYPGIYDVTQDTAGVGQVLFPTQIVVTRELSGPAHSSLRILTNRAEESDVRRFLGEAMTETEQGDQNNVDSILQVSVSANSRIFEQIRRDSAMCQALRELMKDEIQKDVDAGRAAGRAEGRAEGIQATVEIYREDLGLDDQTIIGKLAARFHLTREQAQEYVLSRAL